MNTEPLSAETPGDRARAGLDPATIPATIIALAEDPDPGRGSPEPGAPAGILTMEELRATIPEGVE